MVTLTGEHKPVGFIGIQTVEPHPVRGHQPRNLPVLIKANAFSPGAPARDLTTSWWHGVMLQGPWIEKWFGHSRVIIPAGRLINGTTIRQVETRETITLYNIVTDAHDVVFAEGAAVETFRPVNGNHRDFAGWQSFAPFNLPQAELEARYPAFCHIIESDAEGRFIGQNLDRIAGVQISGELTAA